MDLLQLGDFCTFLECVQYQTNCEKNVSFYSELGNSEIIAGQQFLIILLAYAKCLSCMHAKTEEMHKKISFHFGEIFWFEIGRNSLFGIGNGSILG